MTARPQTDPNAPWKQRFRAPVVAWTQVAPLRRERGLAASNRSGLYQLYSWNVPTGELRQLTDRPEGIIMGSISPDGGHVYYFDDAGGNEIGHYVRVPFEGGEPEDVTPDLPDYSSFGLGFSRSGNLVGLIAADREGFHLYALDTTPDGSLAAPRRLYDTPRFAAGPTISADGRLVVLGLTERSGTLRYDLAAFDSSSGEKVAELSDGDEASVEPAIFSRAPGDGRMIATTNRTGLTRPFVWNPETGERRELELPGVEGEVGVMDWSEDCRRLLLVEFVRAVQRLYLYDLESDRLSRLSTPNGTYFGVYFYDGEIYAQWQDATHPTQLVALDGTTGEWRRTVLAAGEVPPSRPWRSVSFRSSDGTEIQAWLTVPEGEGPFPTILETHGGPQGVTTDSFKPDAQAWLDHGFAFLSVNYRGSLTFGRDFEEKIWGEPGRWEVEDMVAARDWLVSHGVARPDQIFLTGWSYGGYLTLQALGLRPDLWAGGLAGIAIADWAVQYEDSADTLRAYEAGMFKGTPEERPEQYRRSSPITYAEQVSAPVLIIQGRNDTRTPARPVEMYERRLRELGKPIEVHWFDAGHLGAFAQVEQSIEHQERMIRFALDTLGSKR